MRMMGMAVHVVKSDGVLALYNGLSASLCRQVCVSVCMLKSVLEILCVLCSLVCHFYFLFNLVGPIGGGNLFCQ